MSFGKFLCLHGRAFHFEQTKSYNKTDQKRRMPTLQFVPFSVYADPLFFNELCRRKLNEWKLDESSKKIIGSFNNFGPYSATCFLTLSYDAFSNPTGPASRGISMIEGQLVLSNTLVSFKSLDRRVIAQHSFAKVREAILDGSWLENPSTLNTFTFTVFANLKHFHFHYWNCVPAVIHPIEIEQIGEAIVVDSSLLPIIDEKLKDNDNKPFVMIENVAYPLKSVLNEQLTTTNSYLIVFPDPSPKFDCPGWPLRNMITALAHCRPDINSVRFLCYRTDPGVRSAIIHVVWKQEGKNGLELAENSSIVGWERNINDALLPRFVDLSTTMDPVLLMKENVELNLRLMKWQISPQIQLENYQDTKCLILGSGTLGCNIGRCLLGWGVHDITFVDCGLVSYSNPVRQILFEFSDANARKQKALAASEAMQRIYPFVNSTGVELKIPMPGHTVGEHEKQSVLDSIKKLEELILNHDVVFLLMDSRESRWLPTLLATYHGKLAISVAIGFDSYLVIRHGVTDFSLNSDASSVTSEEPSSIDGDFVPGSQLGCYFCSDITAPGNSTEDRTLDQQCTVTRAGVSMAASGAAVELFAAVMQHPFRGGCPASVDEQKKPITVLGATPHQIRMFFTQYQLMTPTVKRFDHCVACGASVRSAYNVDSSEFLLKVFNNSKYLEEISGLDIFHSSDVLLASFESETD